jgi:hypothetical protein
VYHEPPLMGVPSFWAVRPIAPANTRARGLVVLNDHGVRPLAIAVIEQAVADLQSAIPENRRSAAAFIGRREDFDQFWCVCS